jgi:hypothetical protein
VTLAASCTAEIDLDFDAWDGPYRYADTTQQTLRFAGKQLLIIDNAVGQIRIETGAADVVELVATKRTKRQEDLTRIQISLRETPSALQIKTEHANRDHHRWAIEYSIKIPAGTGVQIDQGVGEVQMLNFQGGSSSINLGVGEVELDHVQFAEIQIAVGVGEVHLDYIDSHKISVDLGMGDLHLGLHPDASFAIEAGVGMGDLSVEGFAQMNLSQAGFISQALYGTIGAGEGVLGLHVGVGDLTVIAREAPKP